MKGVYLLLGSNLGNSRETLRKAIDQIEVAIGNIISLSSVYKTKAWGIEDQPDFLNQVVKVVSDSTAEKMLQIINEIEEKLGRVRHIKWQSRIIDIDILYYGDEIINSDKLVIPHPENQNRNFVLAPMAEIAPDLVHPVLLLTQRELLENCTDTLDVKKID